MASKILITPNAGSTTLDPTIAFQGSGVATDVTLRVPSTGGISFEGTAGQLFSITDSLSGTIFSVNDVSGIPSIEVIDTGLVKLAQYSGNVVLGSGTDDGVNKLQVSGSVIATSFNSITALSSTTPAALGVAAVGTSTTVARSDHVHLAPTTITGNAATATKLASIGTTYNGTYPMLIEASGVIYSHTTVTYNGTSQTLTAPNFSGEASASNLTSGTVPDARISGSYTGMTNLTGTGTVDFAKFAGLATDLVTAPSFTWTGDLTTGFYRPAASQVAVAIAGVQRALITATGITATNLSGTNTGDNPGVTSVGNGNGMNFTTFTTTGTVTLGTPSTLTAATTNAVTASSHTHAITGFALDTHNHTTLTGITSLGFAAEASDLASISTTINASGTYFDFNLTDDNNNDWWRWRFTPSGSTVYDAMTLKPVSNGVANLTVSGTVSGSNLSGTNTGDNAGVTSVATANGTGISVTGGPITTSGTLTITNTAPNVTTNLSTTTTATTLTVVSSDGTNALLPAATTTVAGVLTGADKTKLDGLANYVLPAATISTLGGIELEDATVQTVAANTVTATASRTYGLQVNAAGQGVINVPWVNTTYAAATTTIPGLIELEDATVQTVAANTVTATASRTYGLQVNAAGQGVINVPWVDTNTTNPTNLSYTTAATTGTVNSSTGTNATIPAATTALAGLMTDADKTKLDGIAAGATNVTNTNQLTNGAGYSTTTGTVTSVATSGGYGGLTLTGGTITSTGTITMGGTPTGTWPITAANITSQANSATIASTSASTVSTIVQRDSSGDINARLFKSEYDVTNATIGYIMTQIDTVSNNYIRPSTVAQVAAGLSGQTMNINGSSTSCSGNAASASTVTATNASQNGDGWWRSTGNTGWYSTTHAVGIYATEATNVRTYNGANFIAAGNVTAYSDSRLKENINVIPNALGKVLAIRGVTYTRNDMEDKTKVHTGVIAQEVLEVFPEAVMLARPDDYYTVAYGNMVGLLIEAIKEQQAIIDTQEARISRLEALINKIV